MMTNNIRPGGIDDRLERLAAQARSAVIEGSAVALAFAAAFVWCLIGSGRI
jgi:hypothetical protein